MFTKRLVAVAVLALAVITLAGGVQWTKSSLANPSVQERKKRSLKDEVLLPVFDAAPEEFDPEKREARTKKNQRFNKSKRGLSVLEEQQDGEFSGILLGTSPPPLPVASDLIVVGSIQTRQPYISDNFTVVYTELTVHIEEILSNNASAPVDAYKPLIVNREGGAIRMPNGRVWRYLVAGSGGIPVIGKRYVLFLQSKKAQDYELVCGYELTDKLIIPLEDFRDRDPFLELTEAQFLDLLREKISQRVPESEQ